MDDLISRQQALDALAKTAREAFNLSEEYGQYLAGLMDGENALRQLPSAQPTLYGYNIEHLTLIAQVLQKENLPPERVTEALMDIGSIVAIVRDEFEGSLKRSVEQGGTGWLN